MWSRLPPSARTVLRVVQAEQKALQSRQEALDQLQAALQGVNDAQDTATFIDAYKRPDRAYAFKQTKVP